MRRWLAPQQARELLQIGRHHVGHHPVLHPGMAPPDPAVTLARGFTTTFAGIAINHVPGFIAAQLLGAAAAAGVCAVLFSPSAAHAVWELR